MHKLCILKTHQAENRYVQGQQSLEKGKAARGEEFECQTH